MEVMEVMEVREVTSSGVRGLVCSSFSVQQFNDSTFTFNIKQSNSWTVHQLVLR